MDIHTKERTRAVVAQYITPRAPLHGAVTRKIRYHDPNAIADLH